MFFFVFAVSVFAVHSSVFDRGSHEDIYLLWSRLDATLDYNCAEPFTEERAAAVLESFKSFSDQYEVFSKSTAYRLSVSQYPEFDQADYEIRLVSAQIKTFTKKESLPSYEQAVAIRNDLRKSVIRYLYVQNQVAQKSGFFYAALLIVFLCIVCVSTLIMITYRRIANKALSAQNKAESGQRDAHQFSLAVMRGEEEERARVSHELHDTVAQDIKYAQLLSERLGQLLAENDQARDLSDSIYKVEAKCIQEVRTLCYNLTPPDLAMGSLTSALQHFCRTFQEDSGVDCTLVIAEGTPVEELNDQKKLHVFRLVQEALNNAFHHACAHETSVILRRTKENTLLLLITDDGKGLDLDDLYSGGEHFGIKGMKERVRVLGGKIGFISEPDNGTEVRIEIPLSEQTDTDIKKDNAHYEMKEKK